MNVITLAIVLFYCTAPVLTIVSRYYDYRVGFVQWRTTIPGGKGFLSVGCESTSCSITITMQGSTTNKLLNGQEVEKLYPPLERPYKGKTSVVRIKTLQKLTVTGGTMGLYSVFDLFTVYPIMEKDTIFFFNCNLILAFLLLFSTEQNVVEITCIVPGKYYNRNPNIQLSVRYGRFVDVSACKGGNLGVKSIFSPRLPIAVYYGAVTIETAAKSAYNGGKRFMMINPLFGGKIRLAFIVLHPDTSITYQNESGVEISEHVGRTTPWHSAYQRGDFQVEVDITFKSLFVNSTKDIVVMLNYIGPSFYDITAMTLTPVEKYAVYSYTLCIPYRSHPLKDLMRMVVFIAMKEYWQKIMLNGVYFAKFSEPTLPSITGAENYVWSAFKHNEKLVFTVNTENQIPGIMFLVTMGMADTGSYMNEVGSYPTPELQQPTVVPDVSPTTTEASNVYWKSVEQDLNPALALGILLASLALVVLTAFAIKCWRSKRRRRTAIDYPGSEDDGKSPFEADNDNEERPPEEELLNRS